MLFHQRTKSSPMAASVSQGKQVLPASFTVFLANSSEPNGTVQQNGEHADAALATNGEVTNGEEQADRMKHLRTNRLQQELTFTQRSSMSLSSFRTSPVSSN